jgi:hypothetical protein
MLCAPPANIDELGSAQIPSTRAVLAVCRSAGTAERCGVASLDPDLHEALFGARRAVFISVVFPALESPDFSKALEIARGAAEFRETGSGAQHRYRARFWSSDAPQLRDLFEIVGRSDATEVLIDDRPVPYARELWLPLVWFLIPR